MKIIPSNLFSKLALIAPIIESIAAKIPTETYKDEIVENSNGIYKPTKIPINIPSNAMII